MTQIDVKAGMKINTITLPETGESTSLQGSDIIAVSVNGKLVHISYDDFLDPVTSGVAVAKLTTTPAPGISIYRVYEAGVYDGFLDGAGDPIEITSGDISNGYADFIKPQGQLFWQVKPAMINLTPYAQSQDINLGLLGYDSSYDGTTFRLVLASDVTVFDAQGGYRFLKADTYELGQTNQIVYLSASKTAYVNPDLAIKGTGQNLYLFAEQYYEKFTYRFGSFSVGTIVSGKFIPRIPAFTKKDKDVLTNLIITNNGISVTPTNSGATITMSTDNGLFDVLGGYRFFAAQTIIVGASEICYLSNSPTEYLQPNFGVAGTGQTVYLYKEDYSYAMLRDGSYAVGMFYGGKWVPKIPAFIPGDYSVLENKNLLPRNSNEYSPFIDKLNPFFTKYRERTGDVTLVQIGDSISTDLGYTSPNPDAAISPPHMTELNINAHLEKKLRWKEQQYRRYDNGIFTEILGGGTGSVLNTDSAWSHTGTAALFPYTKVIDSGTDAGVSYKFPENMKRCNFIIHTDFKFAAQTKILIAEGTGLVEVFNGTTWVEAHNYTFVAKESSSLLPSGIYKDVYQKRIHMRSLTNLDEKTVTIQNVGAGRFGYWGIEFSPREHMFFYIAASRGGHDIFHLQQFQEWTVDDFNPDLILQQCCIINEGAQAGGDPSYPPTRTPANFADTFKVYYESLIASGYLVMPYILFVGLQAGIVNPSTGEWGYSTYAGQTVTIDDYIGELANMYIDKDAPFINLFYRFLEIAFRKAADDGTDNIFASAIYGTGVTGSSFTVDSVHLNNYGQEIAKRLLEPYFNI